MFFAGLALSRQSVMVTFVTAWQDALHSSWCSLSSAKHLFTYKISFPPEAFWGWYPSFRTHFLLPLVWQDTLWSYYFQGLHKWRYLNHKKRKERIAWCVLLFFFAFSPLCHSLFLSPSLNFLSCAHPSATTSYSASVLSPVCVCQLIHPPITYCD